MDQLNTCNISDIKVTSWNVRGLRKLIKLKQVISRIKQLKSKIVFLQETHLTDCELKSVRNRWPGQVIHASYNNYARGVIILIHRSIPFQMTKIIKDPAGRYVITQGTILSITLNLVSLYGPNENKPKFFEDLFLTVSALQGLYIIGGDFNCTLNLSIDRSAGSDTYKAQTRRLINQFILDINLVEVWREQNPDKIEFSCHSSIHKSRSHIDYILVSRELLSRVKQCQYDSIVISDHAAISLSIHLGKFIHNPPNWRLQTKWLQNPEFVKFIEEKIEIYFELNTDQTCASVRWEGFKAYIRGEILSFTSTKNKQQRKRMETLDRQIKSLELDLNVSDDSTKQSELLRLRTEYNKLSSDAAAKSLMWLRQSYYDQGEKAGRLLAWRIKKMQSERAINSIKTSSGNVTVDPLEINDSFREFYEKLYKSECAQASEEQDIFLDQLQFQTLTENTKQELDRRLTIEEISQAIKSINSGKAPGPDGFLIEFYKTFQDKLLIPLFNMYEEAYQNEALPPTLRQAMITLILKPGKPPAECSSFRPISLMGVDTKILCKVLARRLDPYISHLVHNDQNGFVPKRQGFHNIRRVLNIIHEKFDAKDTALLSLDARQAFDRIEWSYLFTVLPRYGFGNNFLKWVKLLYTDPKASVLTNNIVSNPITLERSTRQGCPLSPMLFILAIEPLAMTIRMRTDIFGVQLGDQEHRLALYADDLIVFLTRLSISIPKLMQQMELFGRFSGYNINDSKSSILFLNKDERLNPIIQTPFINAKEGFVYLGVKITPDIDTIVATNYDPLISEVEESLNKWMTMPISVIGRINMIKMNILPKFLYLFQSLPLPLPKEFFDKLNGIFNRFIWNNKKPRL
uniref:Reverse transcriptase domain-containing protein n=1 Tax=Oreochromis niloticus TaxID=8128 RepID=A0A669DA51_ORENI